MTLTNFQKAQAQRQTIVLTLTTLETTISNHATTALDKPTAQAFMEMAKKAQSDLMDNMYFFQSSTPPTPADLQVYVDEYPALLSKTTRQFSALHGIVSAFPATSSSTPTPTSAQAVDFRLPRLEIPQFNGRLDEWIAFKDMFEKAIDTNTSISKAQKLTYLKSYLTGEAARHLSTIVISDANYDIAWSTLTKRYQNNRELLFNILKRLTNQPIQHTATAIGIRTIIDTTQACIRSLETLNVSVEHWDAIILFIIFNKLDQSSKELWEQQLPDSDIPKLESIIKFMEQRARALAAGSSSAPIPRTFRQERKVQVNHAASSSYGQTCKMSCDDHHPLFRCPKFIALNITQRKETVRRYSLCYNCLGSHSVGQCSSKHTCRICNKRHNTLIHQGSDNHSPASGNGGQHESVVPSHVAQQQNDLKAATLATARVKIPDVDGYPHYFRCLMDGGSPVSFITEAAAKQLRLNRTSTNTRISGIAATPAGVATTTVTIAVKPHFISDVCYSTNAFVLNKITSRIPSSKLNSSGWDHLKYITLADPDYASPGNIDILLGADVFYSCLEMEKRAGPQEAPFALKSQFGWLVAGLKQEDDSLSILHTTISLDEQLQRFWEAETIPEVPVLTQEEQQCENHFTATHHRLQDGRFQVSIPWKKPQPEVGHSRAQAYRRLLKLEKDFHNPSVKDLEKVRKIKSRHESYLAFMKEYEDMGHMSLVTNQVSSSTAVFYIPHHFVEKDSSTTTKLRVVFDASCKTSTGFSANDSMIVGPTLQDPLHDILLRFRKHNIAFTADVAKMYRQIKVNPSDASTLRIFWRKDPSFPVQEYILNTVTYGTASAPYLAVRCLQQLAKDEHSRFPIASEAALNDFFVDDLMSGQATSAAAITAAKQLIDMCNTCGFPLRKWSSNSQAVLNSIPEELRETKTLISLDDTDSSSIKTLGIQWNPSSDTYHFNINIPHNSSSSYTKRMILSEVSMVFDPLGWLAPVIISCKILLQKVWISKVQWDEHVPENLQTEWITLKLSLKELESVTIPRCIIPGGPIKTILCAFCDSSLAAYSAVIYTLCFYVDKEPQSFLVTSKTKVAPITPVTLPRLELGGAVLLSSLVKAVVRAVKHPFDEIRAYTDSMIVLAWVQSCPTKWKTYVKHRVQKIQNNMPTAKWFHVPGEENPADCASRGITPSQLLTHPLWWNGNNSMKICQPELIIPDDILVPVKNEEQPIKVHVALSTSTDDIISKFSNYSHLQRIISWMFRFTKNCKLPSSSRHKGPLKVEELQQAERTMIRIVQDEAFSSEIHQLQNGKQIAISSKLLPLSPFLDQSGVLRVGGRLRHAKMTSGRKHPILLPHHHHLTKILIEDTHKKHFHAGPQLMMALISQKFWIIRAKDAIRSVTRRCTTCTRHRAETLKQIMGDLPADRVNPSQIFSKCGVDNCGPFITRPPTRSKATIKSYLALFVCFATRAIHIEVVQSLSSDSFIAALRRFISRRGRPSDIFSDNGTNFVKANKEIKELYKTVGSSSHNEAVANVCSTVGIQWHFNPPNSPHFGGLWEAGVRSVKYHLQRVMGNTRYTYEELLTLTTQVEALLNSRPLIPASSDPSDLDALTPAHFLNGQPPTALPEPDYTNIKEGRLDHWKRLQQQKQLFWRRWSSEFISRMQQRPKWMKPSPQIQQHDMVIMKDDNLPPAQWHLGRVISLHPGADGIVRVVTINTAKGQFKRAIHRLCLLPIEKAVDDIRS